MPVEVDDQEYAPVAGIWELREAIASLCNRLYRRGSRWAAPVLDGRRPLSASGRGDATP